MQQATDKRKYKQENVKLKIVNHFTYLGCEIAINEKSVINI